MKDQQFKKVWAIPTYIGAITLLGLLTALLGTGLCYPLSWLAMSIPLMIMIWKIWNAQSDSKKTSR